MERAQADFLSGIRRHIHDHIVGRYDAHYALTSFGWEGKRTLGVGVLINQMEDRLFEARPLALRRGHRGSVGPTTGQLRGSRMMDPRHSLEGQELMLSHSDQEELMDLAALMRGVSGETKAWLGAFLDSDGARLREEDPASVRRLKTALDWLKVAEAAFKSIPMQIELVRERREDEKEERTLTGAGLMGRREEKRLASEAGLSPAVRAMLTAYVVDDDTDEPTKKNVDDGDVFNDFMAGLGALRQAWFKIAMAMVSAPESAQPSEAELAKAFEEDGLKYKGGRLMALDEPPVKWPEAEPNRRARANETFGWPRGCCN